MAFIGIKRIFIIIFYIVFFYSNFDIKLKSQEINTTKTENLKKDLINSDFYILGPGDKLLLDIFDLKEYSGPISIINDGTVSIPMAGNILISGLTINQAIEKIKKEIGKELIISEIQLSIIQTRPIQVVLIGEFKRPGLYKMNNNNPSIDNANNNPGLPTVVDAIKESGGVTKEANLRELVLKRKITDSESSYKKTTINLYDLIFKGNLVNNPYLHDGDILTLKKINNSNLDEFKIASSNLSSEFINVNVIGEVYNPGDIKLRKNSSIIDALLKAGGPKSWRSNTGLIRLIRLDSNGLISSRKIKINKKYNSSKIGSLQLRDGDTILVGTNNFANITDGIAVVTKPFTGLLQIYSLIDLISN